jgi:hypothetical protein
MCSKLESLKRNQREKSGWQHSTSWVRERERERINDHLLPAAFLYCCLKGTIEMDLTRVYIRNWGEGFWLIREAVRVLSGHSLQSLWGITDGTEPFISLSSLRLAKVKRAGSRCNYFPKSCKWNVMARPHHDGKAPERHFTPLADTHREKREKGSAWWQLGRRKRQKKKKTRRWASPGRPPHRDPTIWLQESHSLIKVDETASFHFNQLLSWRLALAT